MFVFHYQIPVSNFAVCANMSSGSMEGCDWCCSCGWRAVPWYVIVICAGFNKCKWLVCCDLFCLFNFTLPLHSVGSSAISKLLWGSCSLKSSNSSPDAVIPAADEHVWNYEVLYSLGASDGATVIIVFGSLCYCWIPLRGKIQGWVKKMVDLRCRQCQRLSVPRVAMGVEKAEWSVALSA